MIHRLLLILALPTIGSSVLPNAAKAEVFFSTKLGPHQQRLQDNNLTQTIVLFNGPSSNQTGNTVTGHLNGQSPGRVDVQAAVGVTLFADGGQAPQVVDNGGDKIFELTIRPNPQNQPGQSLFAALSFSIRNENGIQDNLTYEVSTIDSNGNLGVRTRTFAAQNGEDFFGVVATGPLLSAVKVTSSIQGFEALRHLRVALTGQATIPPDPITIPEPASWLVLCVAVSILMLFSRRQKFSSPTVADV